MKPVPHFPVSTLIHDGGLILAAGLAHAEVAGRLPVGYLPEAQTFLGKVTADNTGQKGKKGALGNLTLAQTQAVKNIQHSMNQARKTAKLAFPGQTVKLHEEFQTGVHEKFDLSSFLTRADIILASVQTAENLPAFKLKGWTDKETTAFTTARQAFGPAEQFRKKSIGGAKDATTQRNADAAELYDHLLTIQNAADLEHPALDPANAGVRDEFLLNTFPPAGGGHGPTPPAPEPPPAKP
jgi:hypothetical protein